MTKPRVWRNDDSQLTFGRFKVLVASGAVSEVVAVADAADVECNSSPPDSRMERNQVNNGRNNIGS